MAVRGFVVGSLALIVLGVLVSSKRVPQAAAQGRSWSVGLLQRAISPEVAGVPQRKAAG